MVSGFNTSAKELEQWNVLGPELGGAGISVGGCWPWHCLGSASLPELELWQSVSGHYLVDGHYHQLWQATRARGEGTGKGWSASASGYCEKAAFP